jgi:hypothetical protein
MIEKMTWINSVAKAIRFGSSRFPNWASMVFQWLANAPTARAHPSLTE